MTTAKCFVEGRWISANCSPWAVIADSSRLLASRPGSRAAPKLIGAVRELAYRCWRRRRPIRQEHFAASTCQPLRSARLRHTSGARPKHTSSAQTAAAIRPATICTSMTSTSEPSAIAVPSNPSRGRPGEVGLRQLP